MIDVRRNLLKASLVTSILLVVLGISIKFIMDGYSFSIFEKTKKKCLVRAKSTYIKVTGKKGILTCTDNKGEYEIIVQDMDVFRKYSLNKEYTFTLIYKKRKESNVFVLSN